MDNRKKKICVIGPLPPPVTGLSKALDTILTSEECRKCFDFTVVDLGSLYKVSGGSLSLDKLRGFFILRKKVRSIVRSGEIHSYYLTIAQSTVGILRDMMILHEISKDKDRKDVIIHLHGGSFRARYLSFGGLMRGAVRRSYRIVTKAIVLGDSLRNMFEGILPDDRVSVVPNCVDDRFDIGSDTAARKADSFGSKESLRILYLSNMIREKGYPEVLEAAGLCQKKGLPFRFVFAGKFYSDDEQRAFEERIRSEGPEGSVEYAGVVDGADKKRLLEESDLFVLPTYYPHEGQPITIIEAMSAGMPVICTDHAGIRDLVQDGINGAYVEKQSPEQIVKALELFSGDRELMRKISSANREKVLKSYTEKQYISNITDVLS